MFQKKADLKVQVKEAETFFQQWKNIVKQTEQRLVEKGWLRFNDESTTQNLADLTPQC